MTVTVDVEIAGIGKDRVQLDGTVTVHRGGPLGDGGKTMKGALAGASLRGKSDLFGDVVAVQSPTELSPCEYKYVKEGQYEGSFDIHGWFWLPKYNTMYYTTAPVRVAGTAAMIPPVGQVAKTSTAEVPLRKLGPGGVDVGSVSNATGEIHAVIKASELTK
jgi:hypothetical protein